MTDFEFCGAVLVKWKGDEEGQPSAEAPAPNKALHRILDTYAGVFRESQGLPLSHSQDQAIVIREGYGSVSVRPCRYAHWQKDVIESMAGIC